MDLSTIGTGDISNHDKRPLSSHTSLVYPPFHSAAMLEDVHASSVAPVLMSHLNFGSLLWGYDRNRLIKHQKRIIRIIGRSKYNSHTHPLFKKLFILKLPDIVSLNALKICYKYLKNVTPVYFTTFDIQPQSSIHDHDTRQTNDIRTHRTRIKLTEKCLRNYLPTIMNLTPAYFLSRVNTPYEDFRLQ